MKKLESYQLAALIERAEYQRLAKPLRFVL